MRVVSSQDVDNVFFVAVVELDGGPGVVDAVFFQPVKFIFFFLFLNFDDWALE
jgi:hypothetical protein